MNDLEDDLPAPVPLGISHILGGALFAAAMWAWFRYGGYLLEAMW